MIPFGVAISLCGVYGMPGTGFPCVLVHQMAATNAE